MHRVALKVWYQMEWYVCLSLTQAFGHDVPCVWDDRVCCVFVCVGSLGK